MMPEDRLAKALIDHQRVRRLVVANPYRSILGRPAAFLRREPEPPFPDVPHAHLHEPLRLRRRDPAEPRAAVAKYEASLRRAAERHGLQTPAIITANPLLAGFGDFGWAGPVTYYGWDDWTASEPHRAWWPAYREAFAALRETGRRVCAVTQAALDPIAPTGPAEVIPNAIEPDEWERPAPAPAWFARKASPRMLYIGSLDSRVDIDQALAAAKAHPGGTLTFVGAMFDAKHFAPLRALPNVEFHGQLERAEIAAVIAAADVCLIPHVRNPLTKAMSPLKLYEYLAGGRPVAAVDLAPIAAVRGRVALAPTGGDFLPALARALEIGPAPEEERRAFVRENSWPNRIDRILELALH
jgi:glycosyltransferase involved in cell wall biosynthesis